MPHRNVYLGLLDIDIHGNLDLKKRHGQVEYSDIVSYLFAYGVVADQVMMQGSAPLKSKNIFLAYTQLSEAFQRNEKHEDKPIYSFVLSNEVESYLSYIVQRLSFLRGISGTNTELISYIRNNAQDVSKLLDKNLNLKTVQKRTQSVSSEYKSSLLITLASGKFEEHGITDETAFKAIQLLSDEEIIQTHHLINSLSLVDVEQINSIYRVARDRYKNANAFGCESLNTEAKPHFNWKNISLYLDALNLPKFVYSDIELTPYLLFKIRNLSSLKQMNNIYFECQNQQDITALLEMLNQFKINGKLRSLLKQSPAIAIAFFFETINQAEIGYKTINKALEQLAKVFLSDVTAEIFAKKIYLVHTSAMKFENDLAMLTKHSSGRLRRR